MSLKDSVVLITGCSTGVGKALAFKLSKKGAIVYATMRNIDKASELLKAEQRNNPKLFIRRLDVTDDASVKDLVEEILQIHKRIDVIVNNAGYALNGTHEMNSIEQIKDQFDTNVFGVFRVTNAVLPTFRKQKSGHVIHVGSIGGQFGMIFNDAYCATKFALEGLVEAQAPVNKILGIQTSIIEPGGITSEFVSNASFPKSVPSELAPLFDEYQAIVRQIINSGQTPEQVADVIISCILDGTQGKAHLRYQSSDFVRQWLSTKVSDVSGDSVVTASLGRFFSRIWSDVPKTMDAWVAEGHGPVEECVKFKRDYPVPTPSSTQVLIKVISASVNPVDWKFIIHNYAGIFSKGEYIPGCDVAGVIVKIGSDVKRFKVGDAVHGFTFGTPIGTFAQYTVLEEKATGFKPKSLSWNDAAGLPVCATTSYQALNTVKLTSGQKLLILGGSSGTGVIGVQYAKALGANVYATCSTRNVEFVSGLGAGHVLDYTKVDWGTELKGEDFDIIYDTVGEDANWEKAKGVLKEGGIFCTICVGKSYPEFKDARPGTARVSKDRNIHLVEVYAKPDGRDLEKITQLIEQKKIRPITEATFHFHTQFYNMFKTSLAGRARGKLVLEVSKEEEKKEQKARASAPLPSSTPVIPTQYHRILSIMYKGETLHFKIREGSATADIVRTLKIRFGIKDSQDVFLVDKEAHHVVLDSLLSTGDYDLYVTSEKH